MRNIPVIKNAIVAVSRDCFPLTLSASRRDAVAASCESKGIDVINIQKVIENEKDTLEVLKELKDKGVNALTVFLGNFGPEGPETMLAQRFEGPVMFAAASEENIGVLSSDRGDAFCGMLSASYNLKLRNTRVHIPEYPVGSPDEIAEMIRDFQPIARILVGMKNLKIITYGPRPQDFFACNAPIQPLFDMGVEIMENSELDLFEAYNNHKGDPRIPSLVKEYEEELEGRTTYSDLMEKLAQYELTLLDLMEANKGACRYAVFANKCWPAFQTQFHFVPCYINGRFAKQGIPIACETDIYGALSEYILACATGLPPTLLDINNTVPLDMYNTFVKGKYDYELRELFMGFHCGNTSACFVNKPVMSYQLIMHRLLEGDKEPYMSRGCLDGSLKAGPVTLFRLQSSSDCKLKSYMAHGEILDVDPCSFGGIGIIGVKEMPRFYRHVLLEKQFPHHSAVGFAHAGKTLFDAMKLLGIDDLSYNQPKGERYKTENPFA
ncbi:MAG: L-fucose/L-arabinose isomerase family protein [Clostridia bacterium]|jgi:L-fucose isomerase-like protein|nr:fucose isomerase [Clostridiaceae bacterium]